MQSDTEVRLALHDHGYRLTSPRWLVWSVLHDADGHLTAEEITARVNDYDPTVNRSSVYRSLTLFEELDLARRSQLGIDESARWEIIHPDDQFHLVCKRCGSVDHHIGDVVEQIKSHLNDDHGFSADTVDLVVTGICRTCGGI